MDDFKKELKSGELKRCYLFYGDESYLIRHYKDQIKKTVVGEQENLNLSIFEGKNLKLSDVFDSCDTAPFLSDRRLTVVESSGCFSSGKKDDSERLEQFISDIPDTTVLLFIEADVDKRLKIFKKINSVGRAVEFKHQPEADLIKWLNSILGKHGLKASPEVIKYLIKIVGQKMDNLYNECMKLISFCSEKSIIELMDVEALCTKSIEIKVFDLVSEIGRRNCQKALEIYNELIFLKEAPLMILTMIARQIRLFAQSKALTEKACSKSEIAAKIGVPPFFVSDYINQSKNFTSEELIQFLYDCQKTDVDIKSGKIAEKLAVEMLIVAHG